MKVRVRCPYKCIYPKRTYEDVQVGQVIECTSCRQRFTVTEHKIVEYLPDDAPLAYKDQNGVPLSVPTELADGWLDINCGPGSARMSYR